MPSPFPGMDPFLEDQEWEDFHSRFNNALSDAIAPGIAPRYIVRVERRVYVESGLEGDDQIRWADVSVLWSGTDAPVQASGTSVAFAAQPIECLLPGPQERRETYLVIRDVPTMEIVTVIETLSPANKRASSDGRQQYLEKRDEILRSRTNLVEIDLLRGGKRLPMQGMPPGDYFAIISRGHRRPRADVFHWTLADRLPTIPIPLKANEPEADVDLQQVFNTVYDRALYNLSLNYAVPLKVPLDERSAAFVKDVARHKTQQ